MKVLQLDTEGESRPHLCNSAFFDQAYNWRTGGFNLWRCQKRKGHKGPHEAVFEDDGLYVRIEWQTRGDGARCECCEGAE